MKTPQVQNARSFPKIFYCRHMQPGVAGYENETLLVNSDAMKSMIPSFTGKPIYVQHQDVDVATLKEDAAGYVADSFYNELDGWAWAKMLVIDDEAIDAIARGWAVSNAYLPTQCGASGTEHNVNYDRSVNAAEFTHLAIVPNPRYEQAKVYSPEEFKSYQESKRQQMNELKNSKDNTTKGSKMKFDFWNSKKEAATEIDADTVVEITNAKGEKIEVKVSDMIETVTNAKVKKNEADEEAKKLEEKQKGAEKDNSKVKLNAESKVTVGDEEMTMGELMNRYGKMNADADDEDTKKKAAEEKANSDKEAEEKKNAKTAAGEKTFEELRNAGKKGTEAVVNIDTESNKLARGANRYGSASK